MQAKHHYLQFLQIEQSENPLSALLRQEEDETELCEITSGEKTVVSNTTQVMTENMRALSDILQSYVTAFGRCFRFYLVFIF